MAKRAGCDLRYVLLLQLGVVVFWAPVGLWFAWREAPGYGLGQWGLVAVSGILHTGYFLALMRGYRRAISRSSIPSRVLSPAAYVLVLYAVRPHVAPAREVSTLFAALLGGGLLREENMRQRVVGALCIAAGVIALALS